MNIPQPMCMSHEDAVITRAWMTIARFGAPCTAPAATALLQTIIRAGNAKLAFETDRAEHVHKWVEIENDEPSGVRVLGCECRAVKIDWDPPRWSIAKFTNAFESALTAARWTPTDAEQESEHA